MNKAKLTRNKNTKKIEKVSYRSPLREEQTKLTQAKIQDALFELFQEGGGADSITYKTVAKKAGVTEMTVFRYYPDRAVLLKSLWERINDALGKNIRMPQSADDLLQMNENLHLGFDQNPAISVASVTTPQGREMRTSLNEVRRESFLRIVNELNPKLDKSSKVGFAAILQLLHSAYAWDSLKQQWNLDGPEIADATSTALSILMSAIKKGKTL